MIGDLGMLCSVYRQKTQQRKKKLEEEERKIRLIREKNERQRLALEQQKEDFEKQVLGLAEPPPSALTPRRSISTSSAPPDTVNSDSPNATEALAARPSQTEDPDSAIQSQSGDSGSECSTHGDGGSFRLATAAIMQDLQSFDDGEMDLAAILGTSKGLLPKIKEEKHDDAQTDIRQERSDSPSFYWDAEDDLDATVCRYVMTAFQLHVLYPLCPPHASLRQCHTPFDVLHVPSFLQGTNWQLCSNVTEHTLLEQSTGTCIAELLPNFNCKQRVSHWLCSIPEAPLLPSFLVSVMSVLLVILCFLFCFRVE